MPAWLYVLASLAVVVVEFAVVWCAIELGSRSDRLMERWRR